MTIDFNAMPKAELRAYVISHPKDDAAFEIFVDRFTAEAPAVFYDLPKSMDDMGQLEAIFRKKLDQSNEE
jgi:hypothetical protein